MFNGTKTHMEKCSTILKKTPGQVFNGTKIHLVKFSMELKYSRTTTNTELKYTFKETKIYFLLTHGLKKRNFSKGGRVQPFCTFQERGLAPIKPLLYTSQQSLILYLDLLLPLLRLPPLCELQNL